MLYFVFIFVFILTDICKSEKGETLVCRYDPEFASLERVWCKKDSEECCTGFAFGKKIQSLDNGSVEITNDTAAAFTVTVQNLTQGSGVYWCGLMFQNQTIIKLAEKSFSTDSPFYVWSLLRWILFALLLLSSFGISMFTRKTAKKEKVDDCVYEDVPLRATRGTDGQADIITEA
ncbi:uncharacterized protein si:ch211-102c2.4 [Clupea harengus]|uniref:Uncharacterized protein si:ch211-102c2.4 n=1 Tax=Clupea harengus TaxID=7950 RepID=A0A8M1KJY0_CLUHA|nr:uncharacterized protein si:ch211-102c2.4 [Clupea harengus]